MQTNLQPTKPPESRNANLLDETVVEAKPIQQPHTPSKTAQTERWKRYPYSLAMPFFYIVVGGLGAAAWFQKMKSDNPLGNLFNLIAFFLCGALASLGWGLVYANVRNAYKPKAPSLARPPV